MVSAVHTGWRFAADVKQTYGADDYVEKPFEAAELLRRVEALLSRTPAAVAPASEAAARQQLKEGVIALKHDRLDDALAAFSRGLAIDQFSDLLHYYTAMTYEKKDMVFHAIDHYEKAIELNPGFYDAITSLANLYQKQEFWRKAAEMWELALSATKDEAVRARIKDHLLAVVAIVRCYGDRPATVSGASRRITSPAPSGTQRSSSVQPGTHAGRSLTVGSGSCRPSK